MHVDISYLTQVDVAKVLLLAGADAHARDHRSRCPLHMASLAGSEELARALLTCGADPNKASDIGTTALHNAVRGKEEQSFEDRSIEKGL